MYAIRSYYGFTCYGDNIEAKPGSVISRIYVITLVGRHAQIYLRYKLSFFQTHSMVHKNESINGKHRWCNARSQNAAEHKRQWWKCTLCMSPLIYCSNGRDPARLSLTLIANGVVIERAAILAMSLSSIWIVITSYSIHYTKLYEDFRSIYAMVPAVISLLLIFIPAILMALGVVREKELGSITNLYVTPVTRLEFLFGKQLPYVVLAMISYVLLIIQAVSYNFV